MSDIFLNRRLRWLAPIEYIPSQTGDNGSETGDNGDGVQSIPFETQGASRNVVGAFHWQPDSAGDYDNWLHYKERYNDALEAAARLTPDDLQLIRLTIIIGAQEEEFKKLDLLSLPTDETIAALRKIYDLTVANELLSVDELTEKYPNIAGEITMKILLDRMPRMVSPPWYFGDIAKD